mgnify:CR=1 FL=1
MTEQPSPDKHPSEHATHTGHAAGDARPNADKGREKHQGSIPETLIALIISLAMAFIAKTYVIEAYRIPTGSMAPTLLGAHMRFTGPQTGHDWAVDNWYYLNLNGAEPAPLPTQGDRVMTPSGRTVQLPPPAVTDPMTAPLADPPSTAAKPGSPVPEPVKSRPGDRILVQKYLYEIADPERFDVVVFKNPSAASVNYIKRLVGLPREALWLVDGDVFTHPLTEDQLARHDGGSNPDDPATSTELIPDAPRDTLDAAWRIQRKPLHIQRRVWRPVFDAALTPIDHTTSLGDRYFTPPWNPDTGDWDTSGPVYTLASQTGRLAWDARRWPVTDMIPFNEYRRTDLRGPRQNPASSVRYPVSDIRARLVLTPGPDNTADAAITFTLNARERTITASIENETATVTVTNPDGSVAATQTTSAPRLTPGRPTPLEFWHADQAVSLFVAGEPVIAQLPYDAGPAERLENATTLTLDEVMRSRGGTRAGFLDNPSSYAPATPELSITVAGGPAQLRRLALDKDLYYRPLVSRDRQGLAVHPERLGILGQDQFFVLGDNSAASLDSRAWQRAELDNWVERALREWSDDPEALPPVGVVPRKLLLGRAFFVYWPAAYRPFNLFVPDFGRMRFIY